MQFFMKSNKKMSITVIQHCVHKKKIHAEKYLNIKSVN